MASRLSPRARETATAARDAVPTHAGGTGMTTDKLGGPGSAQGPFLIRICLELRLLRGRERLGAPK
jgi:hypothetical protein